MEQLEGQEVAIAVAVGGAMVFAAFKLLSGFISSSSVPKTADKTEKVSEKPKKSKKKAKSKKKPVKKVTIQEEKKKPKVVEKPVVETSKKKKKKKKAKKKAPVVVESDSDSSEEDVPKKKQVKKEEKKILKASDFYKSAENVDDGWETVPVKPRKAKPLVVESVDSSSSGKGKKREKRQVVNIGDYVAVVLGEKGKTISNIQEVSGAKVNVNKEAKTCTIIGDEDCVAVAVQLVVSLVSNQAQHTFTVSNRLQKTIMSKSDIRMAIKDLSGAKIDLSFGKTKDDPLTVLITGETDKVEHAKKLVKAYLEGKNPEGGDGVRTVKVTGFQGRILIGQKGAQISKLQKESGASINVEFEGERASQLAIVSLIGDEDQIQTGLRLIQEFLIDHNVKTRVELNPDARGVITRLQDLRKMLPNLDVNVSPDRSQILLCGSAEGVTKGSEVLQDWIERELGPPEIKSGEVLESIDLGSAAGKVIGKNRSTLNQIIANSKGAKVEIKRGTICYVFGSAKSVQKAFKMIQDIVEKHNKLVAKSQLETERMKEAAWDDEKVDFMTSSLKMKSSVAPASDWGGFSLAQAQSW